MEPKSIRLCGDRDKVNTTSYGRRKHLGWLANFIAVDLCHTCTGCSFRCHSGQCSLLTRPTDERCCCRCPKRFGILRDRYCATCTTRCLRTVDTEQPEDISAGSVVGANQSALSEIVDSAAADFSFRGYAPVNQDAYARAFGDFLHQLQPTNQSALSQAFADKIASTMASLQENQDGQPDPTGAYMVLAHAAGLDDAFVPAWKQVCMCCILLKASLEPLCLQFVGCN